MFATCVLGQPNALGGSRLPPVTPTPRLHFHYSDYAMYKYIAVSFWCWYKRWHSSATSQHLRDVCTSLVRMANITPVRKHRSVHVPCVARASRKTEQLVNGLSSFPRRYFSTNQARRYPDRVSC